MNNLAQFGYTDLVTCFGEAAICLPENISSSGVSTDTRTLQPGALFVALRGENFDAHTLLTEATVKGAVLLIVDAGLITSDTINGVPLIRVESTLHALGTLAWYHRQRFSIPILAIAGSAGKTSTKELAAHVLNAQYHVLKTHANHNNQIGTPLTLLQLTDQHTAAVIEIGTNEPGEIEILCAMVRPTHGLITQIGKEHLEKLIDLDGVEKEETTLFEFLIDTGGTMLINLNDVRIAAWVERHGGRGLSFGINTHADISASVSFTQELNPIIHVVHERASLRSVMKTTGYAAAMNAVAAIAVGAVFELTATQIKQALESYMPEQNSEYGRMKVERSERFTLLNDTYNANPDSMNSALKTLQLFPAVHRVAVLGDMRELGTASEQEHTDCLNQAADVADTIITLGTEFAKASQNINHPIHCFGTHNQCADFITANIPDGSCILVKGSRGLTMEKVVSALKGR
ncbi:MAG: UDP-N-acetylmuramoyl-tripeptide--D-alanyl-D-alanine ligase [Chlorobi bacterium]|nr:MAG: UDP-N-acetylmuramoyl-tripeptide--D-alanyl-D-alanine ligase [Bacteroidota bacterium]KXK34612.1 MAG: UDP-N-acetylmuramyl pentapeptide synthase [Chlorobi bacterium OLB6]MBE2265924.1 UDP-N-acetylmuramoyl-tripeptide--D-alanyl-D-alanine ligase [Flavobacteriales bacterium]MBL1160915.1 UDP-N-acetylmuramoyl-tripeptide--D-alanyl-D-alanine ligase [Chlorobiota bacterium]MBW7852876.1 UDP-N-acetylmuramoyl-tripeptide--D-alanyl-D-alanine ligase [Candidatus Kapabacteria bacterium]MCC6330893.1 UDP-N-ace